MSNGIDLDVNLASTKDISLCYTKDLVNSNFLRLRLNKQNNLYAIETAYKLSQKIDYVGPLRDEDDGFNLQGRRIVGLNIWQTKRVIRAIQFVLSKKRYAVKRPRVFEDLDQKK